MVGNLVASSSKWAKSKKKKKLFSKVLETGSVICGVAKPKGKCYYYKQLGHNKRQCPDYPAKKKKNFNSCLNVIETCLAYIPNYGL